MEIVPAPKNEKIADYQIRLKKILENPEAEEVIFSHVSNGGTVITLAEIWDVRPNDVFRFVNSTEIRRRKYNDSLNARAEWERETILNEIRQIGTANLAAIFDEDGKMKPVSEWPEAVKKSLVGIEVDEIEEGIGNERISIGYAKKIKTESKLVALKMLGNEIGMFKNKVEVTGKMTLEMLVEESMKKAIDVPATQLEEKKQEGL